jgi:hypothetical protein
MEITNELIIHNKDKILELKSRYENTSILNDNKGQFVKDLAKLFGCTTRTIYREISNATLEPILSKLFEMVSNINNLETPEDSIKLGWVKRGIGAKPIEEVEIRMVQEKSKSAFEAARKLGVSYNTYKKYAKLYDIFDDLKNPAGIGIKRTISNVKPQKISSEEWSIKLKRRELKQKHLSRYHDKNGDIFYGCALYIITIPKGDNRMQYINKWGNLPIKIGISIDVVRRYSDMILDKTYVYSKEEKWMQWNQLAEIINIIPFYTREECVKVEGRIHAYIRDYRITGIKTKEGNDVWELFDAPFEKINEAIEIYATGWRTLKWDDSEMNNHYDFW